MSESSVADRPGEASAKVPRARWLRVGVLLFLVYLVNYGDRSNVSVAAPSMVVDLQLSGTVTGVLLSAFFWGYVVTQVPGGWMAERFSAKWMIVWSLVLVGVTACLTGIVQSYEALLAVRFVMGLAEGAVWPSFAVMFLQWFPGVERGRAVSLSQYAMPLATVLVAPLAGWMIDIFDWRLMFILQGAPNFLLAAVFAWLVPDRPEDDRRLSTAERDYIVNNREQETKAEGTLLQAFRSPSLWVLCVLYFLWITGMYAFGMWLPTVLGEASEAGAGAVGWLTALPYAVAVVAMYFNSRWSDRSRHSRGWFVGASLLLGGVALVSQHFIQGGALWSVIMLTITGVGLYSAFGTWWTWAMSQVPRNQAGPSIGLINFAGNFGGIVGPIVVGAAATGGDASSGLYMLGVVLIVAAVLAALLARREQTTQANESQKADTISA